MQGHAQKVIQEFRDAQARVGDGIAEIHVKPTVVEVKLVEGAGRISDTWPLTVEAVNGMNGSVSNIRAWGTYLSSVKHNCDIIMNPIYKVENDPATGGYTVTVVGYPGIFVNWHPATAEDMEWMKIQKSWNRPESEIVAPVVKR